MIAKLNKFRNFMISSSSSWVTTQVEVLSSTPQSIMFTKGPVITVLTNVGSPVCLRTEPPLSPLTVAL